MTSRYLRLKDNHPIMQKLEKIFSLADELGISISFSAHGPATIHDKNRNLDLPSLNLQDLEDSNYPMEHFPPTLEYRVICENPEWLAQQEKIHAAEAAERKRKFLEEEARKIEREKREAERMRLEHIQTLKASIAHSTAELKRLEHAQ
jgi:hypothetical protein